MMLLKNFSLITLISLLSISMTKTTPSRIKVKERKHGLFAETDSINSHRLPIRHHSHFVMDRKYKCSWDRFHNRYNPQGGKQSRYPTLDKIVSRLNNLIDRQSNKPTITTVDPFTQWDVQEPNEVSEKRTKYTYVTIGFKNKTKLPKIRDKINLESLEREENAFKIEKAATWKTNPAADDEKFGDDSDDDRDEDEDEDDSDNDDGDGDGDDDNHERTDYILSTYTDTDRKKGSVADFTTSGPWDDEPRDTLSQIIKTTDKLNDTKSSSLLLPSSETNNGNKELGMPGKKLPESSLGRLIPKLRDAEDRKKKAPSTPYVAAHEHYEHVLRLGDCHTPKEKVIRVHEIHPDPSKSYSPSCTILHQCSDDTGCCRDIKQECKPKNTTKVELYFFTTTLGKPQTVEKLYFVNHTECECQKRTNDLMPRDSEYHVETRPEKARGRDKCICPSKFSTRGLRNGTCICDCFDKQRDCLALKKGKNIFPHYDKLCIQKSICSLPSCEFGSYLKEFGRCPRKKCPGTSITYGSPFGEDTKFWQLGM